MEVAETYTDNEYKLKKINNCRMYIHAMTMSDLMTNTGNTFNKAVTSGSTKCPSVYDWLVINKPKQNEWKE